MNDHFSHNLRYLRENKRKKQSEMLFELGIKATRWNNYEKKGLYPPVELLIKISKYFGISEADLLHTDIKANAHIIAHRHDKKEEKEPCPECALKDKYIAYKDSLIYSLEETIQSQKTTIQLLQNMQEQSAFSFNERSQKRPIPAKKHKPT